MINVLIADNHPIIREGIKHVLTPSPDINVIGFVGTTSELFSSSNLSKADIIILEMDIPEVNGIRALKELKKQELNAKVLIYSRQSEDIYALSTIRAGASGYLTKSSDIALLPTAIKKIHEGGMFITNDLAQRLAFDEGTQKPRRFFKKLSSREVEVLKLLASGKRNKEVAEELDLNEKTISTYKARLMRKLNVDNMVDLLQQAKALESY